jgi:hypothetical protein
MNILRTNRATNQTSIVTLEAALTAIEREHDSNPLRIAEQLAQGVEFVTSEGYRVDRPISYRRNNG